MVDGDEAVVFCLGRFQAHRPPLALLLLLGPCSCYANRLRRLGRMAGPIMGAQATRIPIAISGTVKMELSAIQ